MIVVMKTAERVKKNPTGSHFPQDHIVILFTVCTLHRGETQSSFFPQSKPKIVKKLFWKINLILESLELVGNLIFLNTLSKKEPLTNV